MSEEQDLANIAGALLSVITFIIFYLVLATGNINLFLITLIAYLTVIGMGLIAFILTMRAKRRVNERK